VSYSSGPSEFHAFGSTLAYTCDTGYSLIGNDLRICVDSGVWSGNAPLCSAAVCPELPEVVNGVITFTMNSAISISATYSCDTGYAISSAVAVRTCDQGVWSGTAPICEGMTLNTFLLLIFFL